MKPMCPALPACLLTSMQVLTHTCHQAFTYTGPSHSHMPLLALIGFLPAVGVRQNGVPQDFLSLPVPEQGLRFILYHCPASFLRRSFLPFLIASLIETGVLGAVPAVSCLLL